MIDTYLIKLVASSGCSASTSALASGLITGCELEFADVPLILLCTT